MKIDNTFTAVSSRIRLARNFDGYKFSSMIRGSDFELQIRKTVCDLFYRKGGFEIECLSNLTELEKQSLQERYVISSNLAKNNLGAFAISQDKTVSVMINEEDHVREQCIMIGLDLVGAYKKIVPIDTFLGRNLRFAKDGDFYLTSCPSNLGSGLRASVMMFLPCLSYLGLMDSVVANAKQNGITVRGAFGEGSDAEGYWYQISNSKTIGNVEQIINNVEQFVLNLSDEENDERYRLYETHKNKFEDKCFRSLGILKNARVLTQTECVEMIAEVKLGNALEFINLKNPKALDDLLVTVRPATLKLINEENIDEQVWRATCVRNALKMIE